MGKAKSKPCFSQDTRSLQRKSLIYPLRAPPHTFISRKDAKAPRKPIIFTASPVAQIKTLSLSEITEGTESTRIWPAAPGEQKVKPYAVVLRDSAINNAFAPLGAFASLRENRVWF